MIATLRRAMVSFTDQNRASVVAFFAFLIFFFGCGGDPGGRLPDEARSGLLPQVEAIRAAAAAGDRAGAQAGVDQLRARLSDLRGRGVLGEEDTARVLDAVDTVEARLALLPAPTTTTTAPPPPADVAGDEGDGDGKPKGKGHKNDNDDG